MWANTYVAGDVMQISIGIVAGNTEAFNIRQRALAPQLAGTHWDVIRTKQNVLYCSRALSKKCVWACDSRVLCLCVSLSSMSEARSCTKIFVDFVGMLHTYAIRGSNWCCRLFKVFREKTTPTVLSQLVTVSCSTA